MKLDDWLTLHGMSSAEFGRRAGIGGPSAKQVIHKYRRGERFPTPENLSRITAATNGQVTANDFVQQHAAARAGSAEAA